MPPSANDEENRPQVISFQPLWKSKSTLNFIEEDQQDNSQLSLLGLYIK